MKFVCCYLVVADAILFLVDILIEEISNRKVIFGLANYSGPQRDGPLPEPMVTNSWDTNFLLCLWLAHVRAYVVCICISMG